MRGVDAQRFAVEDVHRGLRQRGILARSDEGRRLATRDLDREARPRQHAARHTGPLGARDLVPERATAVLETLAQPQRRLRRRQLVQQLAQRRHRRGQQQQAVARMGDHRVQAGLDEQRLRQRHVGQVARVAALRAHLPHLIGVARPQPHVVAPGGGDRQRRAPGTTTEHADAHRAQPERRRFAAAANRQVLS